MVITFESSNLLDNGNNLQLQAVRQMFAPGSFVLVVPVTGSDLYITEKQSQCALVQVTGEVQAGGWPHHVELADRRHDSQFNANLQALLPGGWLGDARATPILPRSTSKTGLAVRRRLGPRPLTATTSWSRSAARAGLATRSTTPSPPVRCWSAPTSSAGVEGDPTANTTNDYPGCTGGSCRMPTLYLPSAQTQPPRVAIGPMIEDMQVAVGCDGWGPDSDPVVNGLVPLADPGFEEKAPSDGPLANLANRKIDERNGDANDRGNDEWVGNANELWAPDCVTWGTGERNAQQWATNGPASESQVAPGFRLSPQVVRVTLLAKPDTMAGGSDVTDAFFTKLVAIEDRPTMDSVAGDREYRTLTERFSIHNAHWRDPAMR